jgi:hypothetical protein
LSTANCCRNASISVAADARPSRKLRIQIPDPKIPCIDDYFLAKTVDFTVPLRRRKSLPANPEQFLVGTWDHDDLYCVYTCGELGVMDQSCVHGNADALSVDISGYGETLLIDPGRYIYEGPWRVWFKSTSAHNTITVDGQDSSSWLTNGCSRQRPRALCVLGPVQTGLITSMDHMMALSDWRIPSRIDVGSYS